MLITFEREGEPGRFRGSGVRVHGDLILTADHCADGHDHRVWWTEQGRPAEEGRPATVVWRSRDVQADLAVLQAKGLPPVDPVPLALLDTNGGGTLPDCTSICYPDFARLDPRIPGGSSGPDVPAPLTGTILLGSAQVSKVPDGWTHDRRVAILLDPKRSLLPNVPPGSRKEVTRAWSAASGGGVLVRAEGRSYCTGVLSALQVKQAPTALRMAGFDTLDALPHDVAARFWATLGVPGPAELHIVGVDHATGTACVSVPPRDGKPQREYLQITDADGAYSVLPLRDGRATGARISLGRSATGWTDPDIVLDIGADSWVSRRHAHLTHRDGSWWLESDGKNGTSVRRRGEPGAQRVTEPVELHDGDTVLIDVRAAQPGIRPGWELTFRDPQATTSRRGEDL